MSETGDYSEEELAKFYKFQLIPDKNYIARLTAQQKKYARIYPVFDQDVKYMKFVDIPSHLLCMLQKKCWNLYLIVVWGNSPIRDLGCSM